MGVFVYICAFVPTRALAELLIVTVEEPPTNYMLEGNLVGTSVDIVERIMKDLHLDAKILLVPPARASKMLLTEPELVLFTVAKTPERVSHGIHFIAPVITTRLAFYKKKGFWH